MKILCTLPNASELINGVVFKPRGDVMLSEDISQELADAFVAIPGYEILSDEKDDKRSSLPSEPVLKGNADPLPIPDADPLPVLAKTLDGKRKSP